MSGKRTITMLIVLLISLSSVFPATIVYSSASAASGEEIAVYNPETVVKIVGKTDIFDLKAKSSILMDAGTGNILLENNSREKLPIASITKIMSMLLVMEAIDSGKINMDEEVTISDHSYSMGGSQVYLEPGEVFTINELLKAVALHSANDATVALAEKVAGSEEAFVMMMNDRAKAIGMNDTNFLDCSGLTDDGHYSTAYDIALMSKELLKHPKIIDFTKLWHETFRNGEFSLDNTNKLIRYYDGMTGLKTGFTNKAGFCLAGTAQRSNLHLIAVVLGEPDSNTRFAEVRKLLDHGFANYESVPVDTKGMYIRDIKVRKGIKASLRVNLGEDVTLLLQKGSSPRVEKEIQVEDFAEAPVTTGQKVGEIIYKIGDNELCRAAVVAESDVGKATFFTLFFRMFLEWFSIGRV